jgi:hypothetical protein
MTLSEIHANYEQFASGIPNWNKMTKSELANGYCDADDAHDELKRSQYYAALMCKYWYMIPYMQKNCQSLSDSLNMSLEDFVAWLEESFDVAFKYRRWRDPTNELSKDPKAPEKIINRCIFSTQKRWYAFYNKDKRRINVYSYSLEESEELHGDGADGLSVEDDTAQQDYCHDLVQHMLDKGKILEAFIIDGVCYQDTFKQTVKRIKTDELDEYRHKIVHESVKDEFSTRKLVEHLTNIDASFLNYFNTTYTIKDTDLFNNTVNELKTESHTKLNNILKHIMSDLRTNKEVASLYD